MGFTGNVRVLSPQKVPKAVFFLQFKETTMGLTGNEGLSSGKLGFFSPKENKGEKFRTLG